MVTLAPSEVEAHAVRLLVENTGLRRRVANQRAAAKQLLRAYGALRAREHARLIAATDRARRDGDEVGIEILGAATENEVNHEKGR